MMATAKDSQRKHPSLLPGQSLLPQADAEWATAEEAIRSYTMVALEAQVTAVLLHSQLLMELMAALAMVVCHNLQGRKEVLVIHAGCTLLVLMVDLEKDVSRSLQELTEDREKDACHSPALTDFCHNLQDLRCRNQAAALFDHDHPSRLPYTPLRLRLP